MLLKIRKLIKFLFSTRLRLIFAVSELAKYDTVINVEQSTLLNLARELNISGGFVVDIGASDGYSMSSTLHFFKNPRYVGLAIECDSEKFVQLGYVHVDFGSLLAKVKVTPRNIHHIFISFGVPKNFEVLNLDIDSYDLDVLVSLLSAGYYPKIISMEINEKIPPGIFFKVNYSENFKWSGDHFYGCSIQAAVDTVEPFGYRIKELLYNNVIFVRSDLVSTNLKNTDISTIYKTGYLDKPDKQKLFYYNSDVDHWYDLSIDEQLREIRNYFQVYNGQYTIKIV